MSKPYNLRFRSDTEFQALAEEAAAIFPDVKFGGRGNVRHLLLWLIDRRSTIYEQYPEILSAIKLMSKRAPKK